MSVWTTDLGQVAESNMRLKEYNFPSLNWFVLLVTVSFLHLTVIIEKMADLGPLTKNKHLDKKCECCKMGHGPGSCLQLCCSEVENG